MDKLLNRVFFYICNNIYNIMHCFVYASSLNEPYEKLGFVIIAYKRDYFAIKP